MRWAVTATLWGTVATASPGEGPVLHEPIAPNPAEDLSMHVVIDGDLPAALWTSAGPVSAPDPRDLPSVAEARYGPGTERDKFRPDRDTRGSDNAYDDPFTPSTAPFKRIAAFDAVRASYELYVQNPTPTGLASGPPPRADEDAFYMDAVVDVLPGRGVRIPSVGPGARLVGGHLGVGTQSLGYEVAKDGADNWYVEALPPAGRMRARLVLEVAIPRAAFGGPIADVAWSELLPAPSLPANVARDADEVSAAIGVSRRMRPREVLARLVEYFRGFSESDAPPVPRRSVYLDLALSKTGVCRHRAFAFMITALELGIPTRLAENEAHAWVEVHDGVAWRRIDLGGAGRLTRDPKVEEARAPYLGPADAFPWPLGSQRSDAAQGAATREPRAETSKPGRVFAPGAGSGEPAPAASTTGVNDSESSSSNRPTSSVSLTVVDDGVRRGGPLHAHGEIRANGQPCSGVGVEVTLRNRQTQQVTFLGTLATNDDGSFVGSVVVPGSTPVGDYDFIAKTAGNGRCGPGPN